jgi:transcription elongation factor Elf1
MTEVIQRGLFEDSLVCGSCQSYFPFGNFVNFVQHKKSNCEELTAEKVNDLVCQSCPLVFATAWSLLRHAQKVHALKIYLEKSSEELVRAKESQKARIDETQIIAACLKDFKTTVQEQDCDRPKDLENVTQELDKGNLENNGRGTDTAFASSQTVQPPDLTHDIQKLERFSKVVSDNVVKASGRSLEQKEENDMSIQLEIVDNDDDNNSGTTKCAKLQRSSAPTDRKVPAVPLQRVADATFKKCCSSVVPKKRKRHFETKHMMVGFSSGSSKSRRRLTSPVEGPTSIYIDFNPQDEYRGKCNIEQSYAQRVFCSSDSQDCETNAQCPKESKTQRSFDRCSAVTDPSLMPVSNAANAPPLVPVYNTSALGFSLPVPEKLTPNAATDRKNWNFDRFGQSAEDCSSRPVIKDQAESRSFLIELPLYSKCSVSDVSGLSEREMGFGLGQGSESNGQKKRRYPTSRPFKCDKCEDSFNQRIHLQKHQSKHTGVKPFKCDRCDYSTVERSHLKVHIRVHTGEKPYKCTFCGYATAQNSTLKIHLKRHHLTAEGTSTFTCSTCGLRFQHRDLFANHAVQEHSRAGNSDGEETSNLDVAGHSSMVSHGNDFMEDQTK